MRKTLEKRIDFFTFFMVTKWWEKDKSLRKINTALSEYTYYVSPFI